MKSMAESMEFLRKQNEDLNTRLTAVEARSSQKEREHEERCETKRRDRVFQGKRLVNLEQPDNESIVQGDHRILQNEEQCNKKSHRVESSNCGSRRERSRRKKS